MNLAYRTSQRRRVGCGLAQSVSVWEQHEYSCGPLLTRIPSVFIMFVPHFPLLSHCYALTPTGVLLVAANPSGCCPDGECTARSVVIYECVRTRSTHRGVPIKEGDRTRGACVRLWCEMVKWKLCCTPVPTLNCIASPLFVSFYRRLDAKNTIKCKQSHETTA